MTGDNITTSKENYAEHIAKGVVFIFVMSIGINFISYLIRIFLARSLTPEDYGLIYTAISLLGLLNIFRNLGFSDTLRKKVPEYIVKKDYIKIKSAVALSIIIEFIYTFAIFLIVFVFAGQLSEGLFDGMHGSDVLILLALSGVVSVFYGVISSTLQGLRSVKIYTSLDLSFYTLRLIFIVIFIPFGILALPYSYLTSAIIITIASFLILRIKFSFITKVKITITKKFSKEILYFSLPLMIGYIASSIVNNVSTVILSSFRSLNEVALYQVALPISNLLLLVSSSITIVLLPVISELWTAKRFGTIKEILGLLTKTLFILITPLAMILIAFPENVITIFFGEIYIGAAFTLRILSISSIILSIVYIFSTSLISIGKPTLNTKIVFVNMIVNLILCLILIPLLGLVGAAISLVAASIGAFFLCTYFIIKYTKVNIQWFNLLKILIGGFIALLIIFAIKTILVMNPWIELIISIAVGIIFYTIFVLQTRSVTKDEIKILASINLPIPKVLVKIIDKMARK